MEIVKRYVDKALDFTTKYKEYLMYVGTIEQALYSIEIDPEMVQEFNMDEIKDSPVSLTFVQDDADGYLVHIIGQNAQLWKAIDSNISDEDIKALENSYNLTLPQDYKTYLKYKHFYQLLYFLDIRLFPKPKNAWLDILNAKNKEAREYELAKEYHFVIGEFSDYGYIAINTETGKVDMLDHGLFMVEELADNFSALLEIALQHKEARIK